MQATEDSDRIAVIAWVYEDLYDVIESCLMSPCVGADWRSIFGSMFC